MCRSGRNAKKVKSKKSCVFTRCDETESGQRCAFFFCMKTQKLTQFHATLPSTHCVLVPVHELVESLAWIILRRRQKICSNPKSIPRWSIPCIGNNYYSVTQGIISMHNSFRQGKWEIRSMHSIISVVNIIYSEDMIRRWAVFPSGKKKFANAFTACVKRIRTYFHKRVQ